MERIQLLIIMNPFNFSVINDTTFFLVLNSAVQTEEAIVIKSFFSPLANDL